MVRKVTDRRFWLWLMPCRRCGACPRRSAPKGDSDTRTRPRARPFHRLDQTVDRGPRLGDVITVMEAEGSDYGAQLRDEMFPDRPQAEWDHQVARIYIRGAYLSVIYARLEGVEGQARCHARSAGLFSTHQPGRRS